MANDPSLPNMQEPVFPGGKPPTPAYRKFWEQLSRVAAASTDSGLQAQIDALAAQVAALDGSSLATFTQGIGISIFGQITDEEIRIALNAYLSDLNDVSAAEPADGDLLTWDATLALWKPAPNTASGEILIQDGSSAPPVMLTNEAEDDFLYGDT